MLNRRRRVYLISFILFGLARVFYREGFSAHGDAAYELGDHYRKLHTGKGE